LTSTVLFGHNDNIHII